MNQKRFEVKAVPGPNGHIGDLGYGIWDTYLLEWVLDDDAPIVLFSEEEMADVAERINAEIEQGEY